MTTRTIGHETRNGTDFPILLTVDKLLCGRGWVLAEVVNGIARRSTVYRTRRAALNAADQLAIEAR